MSLNSKMSGRNGDQAVIKIPKMTATSNSGGIPATRWILEPNQVVMMRPGSNNICKEWLRTKFIPELLHDDEIAPLKPIAPPEPTLPKSPLSDPPAPAHSDNHVLSGASPTTTWRAKKSPAAIRQLIV